MINALNSAITGLKAAAERSNAVSHNIANVNTDNYKRDIAVQSEDASGGVTVNIRKDQTPGSPVRRGYGSNSQIVESSNVDIAQELVELIKTKHALTASIKVIQTENDKLGELINIKI